MSLYLCWLSGADFEMASLDFCVFLKFSLSLSRIFLVDHAWTFEEEHAKKILKTNANLLGRMIGLTECLTEEEINGV